MRKLFLPLILFPILLSSCFKDDEPVLPHDPGDVQTDTIGMGQYYQYQVYFDLGTGSKVASNLKSDFDLGFEGSDTGWRVILNTSTFMKVADAGIVPFGTPMDTTGLTFRFDKSDGNPDSLAIGKWFIITNNDTVSNQHVFILDRGLDENGFQLGLRQLIIDSLSGGSYYFRLAFLDGSNPQSYAIPKDPAYNFVNFTMKFGGVVKKTEPPKESYDLAFTQYTTLLFTDEGDPYPYIVTGVLINRHKAEVAMNNTIPFNEFELEDTQGMQSTRQLDFIGYEWKYYDFTLGTYSVDSEKTYVIRDTEGYLYKLRFIGFYNESGEKGYPVIEYQLL